MFLENLQMALLSLRSAKLRSFLTMLGIIIGIAAVISITAVGEGLKAQVNSQITGLGANAITITSGQVVTKSGGQTRINPASSAGTSTLTQEDLTNIEHAQYVSAVAPISLLSGLVTKGDNQAPDALVLATTTQYDQIRQDKYIAGGFFNEKQEGDYVAVLGYNIAQELFSKDHPEQALNQTISIRGQDFTVVGIIKQSDNGLNLGGAGFDSAVYLPIDTAKKITTSPPQIFRMIAQADTANHVDAAVKNIHDIMLRDHGGQEDFSVLTQADLLSTTNGILNNLEAAIAAIAAIALLVGGIGIMNIMLVSVTERTREIGIRKAIGASRRMILSQFLIEAIVLSLLGGILGLAAAYGQAEAAGHLIKIAPVFTARTILLAFGVSVGIGVVFGLAPAIKAAAKKPIEALRYE